MGADTTLQFANFTVKDNQGQSRQFDEDNARLNYVQLASLNLFLLSDSSLADCASVCTYWNSLITGQLLQDQIYAMRPIGSLRAKLNCLTKTDVCTWLCR